MPVLALTNFFHSGFSVSFSYYMAMTLSLLKSSHITAGYASFDTDQYHGTGMPVSFSNYLTLTSPMGRIFILQKTFYTTKMAIFIAFKIYIKISYSSKDIKMAQGNIKI